MKPSLILISVNVTVPSTLFTTHLSNDCLVCAAHIQVQFGRTSNWRALSTRLCPARHHNIWQILVLEDPWHRLCCVPTDRSLYHRHIAPSATGVSLPPGHGFGTVYQDICTMRKRRTVTSGLNSKLDCVGQKKSPLRFSEFFSQTVGNF